MKKYYWMKMNENFFDDETIKFIEEQENGIEYGWFFLKLCLKSLKTSGKLIRVIGTSVLPYDIKALARLTDTPIDVVNSAMTLFEAIGLITVLETGELYITTIEEMIGSETAAAGYMRRQRALEKAKAEIPEKSTPEKIAEPEKTFPAKLPETIKVSETVKISPVKIPEPAEETVPYAIRVYEEQQRRKSKK